MFSSNFQGRIVFPLFVSLFLFSSGSFALPFSITTTSGTTLPTQVTPGQSVTAIYTVSNNTGSVRSGNYVKYLPPNVTQITSDSAYPTLCGPTFTLTPSGTPGSSCTLELIITGNVNAQDPNPHHHLFVCFPGGTTCAGTINPLNVSLATPVTDTQSYIANFGTNSILLCDISSTDRFIQCGDSGADTVLNSPASLAFNPSETMTYITNFGGGGGTVVSLCMVNATTGALSGCQDADSDSTAVFSGPLGVSVNQAGTYAYVANIGDNTVSSCTINSVTGKLSQCIHNGGFSAPIYMVQLTGDPSRAYVSNTGDGSISLCSISATNGTFTNCIPADGDGSAVFNGPALMSINTASTRLYVSDNGMGAGTSVSFCSINLINGKLYNCQDSGVGPIFSSPVSVTLNAENTMIYVSNNNGNTVFACPLNSVTGKLISCSDAAGDGTVVFSGPAGVTLKK